MKITKDTKRFVGTILVILSTLNSALAGGHMGPSSTLDIGVPSLLLPIWISDCFLMAVKAVPFKSLSRAVVTSPLSLLLHSRVADYCEGHWEVKREVVREVPF